MAWYRQETGVSGVTKINPRFPSQMYRRALIVVGGGNARLRSDGIAPTASVGEQYFASTRYRLEGAGQIGASQIIPETGTVTLDITLS